MGSETATQSLDTDVVGNLVGNRMGVGRWQQQRRTCNALIWHMQSTEQKTLTPSQRGSICFPNAQRNSATQQKDGPLTLSSQLEIPASPRTRAAQQLHGAQGGRGEAQWNRRGSRLTVSD
jgi:hypothetical protein